MHPLEIAALEPLDADYYEGTIAARSLLDGSRREVLLNKMLFNVRLVVTEGPQSFDYGDGYCYHDLDAARKAFETWDGQSDPGGWFKNLQTREYRR
jgi:hypothetical protein